jgi:hypothetical protein
LAVENLHIERVVRAAVTHFPPPPFLRGVAKNHYFCVTHLPVILRFSFFFNMLHRTKLVLLGPISVVGKNRFIFLINCWKIIHKIMRYDNVDEFLRRQALALSCSIE